MGEKNVFDDLVKMINECLDELIDITGQKDVLLFEMKKVLLEIPNLRKKRNELSGKIFDKKMELGISESRRSYLSDEIKKLNDGIIKRREMFLESIMTRLKDELIKGERNLSLELERAKYDAELEKINAELGKINAELEEKSNDILRLRRELMEVNNIEREIENELNIKHGKFIDGLLSFNPSTKQEKELVMKIIYCIGTLEKANQLEGKGKFKLPKK